MITLDQLKQAFPNNPNISDWLEPLNSILPKYNINSKFRISMFLAQVAHESGGLVYLQENLNYGEEALQRVFKKYFPTPLIAKQYARNPQKIANKVYANRMGNGDESSGDGWKFKGRGLIQLTGKTNYTNFAKSVNLNLDQTINYLQTYQGALESACWFWNQNNLNPLADKQDVSSVTKKINGGLNGLDDRTVKYNRFLKIFS